MGRGRGDLGGSSIPNMTSGPLDNGNKAFSNIRLGDLGRAGDGDKEAERLMVMKVKEAGEGVVVRCIAVKGGIL